MEDEASETSSLVWVNSLLRALWPNATVALENYINQELTEKLQRDLPSPFNSIHFARFSLGQGVPSFGPIEVRRHSDSQVLIEVEIRYASAVDVLLKAGSSLSLGVKRLDFFGRLCLELKPLLDTWPIVGAVIVYFAAQPKLQLQFCGIVDAPLPGLAKRVQSAVDWLSSTLVLPNFKCLEITSDERLLSLAACTREPIGVLKVHACRGLNLAGANWKMGAVRNFTSNPYCVLRLGGTSIKTSTVKNSTNPDWPDEDAAYFIVHNREQELQVDVMDNDEGFLQRNFVGLLGRLRLSITQLLGPNPGGPGGRGLQRYKLDTKEVKSGLLHVDDPVNTGIPSELDLKFKWLDLASPGPAGAAAVERGEPQGMVLLELHQGTGFPEEAVKALRWKCWILEDQAVYSSNGKPPEHPDFQTSLPDCLHHVIDQLTARDADPAEIADIVEVDVDQVAQYLAAKAQHEQSEAKRKQDYGEVRCVELSWYETLALLVNDPAASISLSLVNSRGDVVGHLAPIKVKDVMSGAEKNAHETSRMLTIESTQPRAAGVSGVLSAWIFPACAPISKDRFRAVQMHVSASYRALAGAAATAATGT